MTRFIAFFGSSSVQSSLIDRIATYAAAGAIDPLGARWTGTSGTPAGCIAADGDPMAFAAATGYPPCLGPFLDFLCAGFGAPSQVVDATTRWLTQVSPGSDVSTAPSRIVIVMLSEACASTELAGNAPRVAEGIDRVFGLHRAAVTGNLPDPRAWSEARAAAVAATDAAEGELSCVCGELAEAAAWDPLASRGLLVEVASRWKQTRGLLASVATGWRKQDDAEVEACFDAFQADFAARGKIPERTSFPAFFGAREPELSRRFIAQLTASNEAFLHADDDLLRESLGCLAAIEHRQTGPFQNDPLPGETLR